MSRRPLRKTKAPASPGAPHSTPYLVNELTPAIILYVRDRLDELLQPGVSNGIFTTLKAALVGLVLVLCMLLAFLEDQVHAS